MTTLLFATDLHGNRAAYADLGALAVEHEVDAVVLGGDLLPLPAGSGPDRVRVQEEFLREQLAVWAHRLRDARPATKVYGLFGNDDWQACLPLLEPLEAQGAFFPLHQRAHRLDEGRCIAGYSCVPVTPFSMSDWDRFDAPGWEPPYPPRRVLLTDGPGAALREASLDELRARPTIQEDLEALAALSDPARTVYVAHTPPHGTGLDLMHGRKSVGSRALRAFVEARQPPLTLHGHIHEAPHLSGTISTRLGRTVCVNPGDSRARLRAVLIDLEAEDLEAGLYLASG